MRIMSQDPSIFPTLWKFCKCLFWLCFPTECYWPGCCRWSPHTRAILLSLNTLFTVSEHARHFQPLGFLFSLSSAKDSSLLSTWHSFPSLDAIIWLKCCPSPGSHSSVPRPHTCNRISLYIITSWSFVSHQRFFKSWQLVFLFIHLVWVDFLLCSLLNYLILLWFSFS